MGVQACILKKNSPVRVENHSCKLTYSTIETTNVPGVKARSRWAGDVRGPLKNKEALEWMEEERRWRETHEEGCRA